MKKIWISSIVVVLVAALAVPIGAQGSLSQQVLQLLTRNNTWSGVNTYLHSVGIAMERGTAPVTTTDRLYNIGGNLYFNGTVLASASSAGTVTSVDMTVPNIFLLAGNPVTSSGTLAVTLSTQSANTVLAGPVSGGAATPTFRALTADDIPGISGTYLTASSVATLTNKSGNISMWTNDSGYVTTGVTTLSSLASVGTISTGVWNGSVIPGTYGGTGVDNSTRTITVGGNLSTAAAFITSGANSLTLTTTGTTNVTLPTTGTLLTNTVTSLPSLATVGTITSGVWSGTAIVGAKGGTGITSYSVGDLLYATASSTLDKLAGVATGNALISGGVNTAPSWGKIGLTTHVSGTLAHGNGGTDVTTVTDDTVLVGSGSAWVATTLGNGVLSYNTSTNAFSVPTTFILGTGAPTPSVNNILLRSNINGVLEVMLGNASALGTVKALAFTGGVYGSATTDEGNSGTTKTIDLSTSKTHKLTLTGNVTLTLTNPADGGEYYVEIYTGAGSYTVTWPSGVKWSAGSTPTITATAAKVDVVHLLYNLGSTDYFGSIVQNYTP